MAGKSRILVVLLFLFGISFNSFIRMTATETVEDKYSVLSKMFKMVFEDMKSQDDRLKTLENPTNSNECKTTNQDGQQDKMTEAFAKTQLNDIQDNIKQVKIFLNHMSKGLAIEKNLRTENTNAIEKNSDNIAKVVKTVNDSYADIQQSLNQQKDMEDKIIKELKTKLKHQEETINAHTDNKISDLLQTFTNELAEHERERKTEMKEVTHVVEEIQSNVDLMASLWHLNTDYNLAKGKHASQSSTMPGGAASRAIDGNKDGDWGHQSCTHTQYQQNPWWDVYLAGTYVIKRVVIKNRSDCCGERLHNLVVSVRKEVEGDDEICGKFEGPSTNSATETIICSRGIIGRYVKIQIMDETSPSYLTLCEVEIYSV